MPFHVLLWNHLDFINTLGLDNDLDSHDCRLHFETSVIDQLDLNEINAFDNRIVYRVGKCVS